MCLSRYSCQVRSFCSPPRPGRHGSCTATGNAGRVCSSSDRAWRTCPLPGRVPAPPECSPSGPRPWHAAASSTARRRLRRRAGTRGSPRRFYPLPPVLLPQFHRRARWPDEPAAARTSHCDAGTHVPSTVQVAWTRQRINVFTRAGVHRCSSSKRSTDGSLIRSWPQIALSLPCNVRLLNASTSSRTHMIICAGPSAQPRAGRPRTLATGDRGGVWDTPVRHLILIGPESLHRDAPYAPRSAIRSTRGKETTALCHLRPIPSASGCAPDPALPAHAPCNP
jgi:hypothetical protein